MRKSLFLGIFCSLVLFSLKAQSDYLYTIQIGTFLEAKATDFKAIQSLGYLYAKKQKGNLYQVYLGKFESKSAANRILAKVKSKSYTNAILKEIPLRNQQTVTVIQIASRNAAGAINWDQYLRVNELYTILNGDKAKIVTGIFPSLEAAKKELPTIRRKGFNDAFVKRVNEAYLHKVTPFETAVKEPLIPISFNEESTTRRTNTRRKSSYEIDYEIPEDYGELTERGNSYAKKTRSKNETGLPKIDGRSRRKSVTALQKALRAERAYSGSLDGYYGKGTRSGFQKVWEEDRTLNKYIFLAESNSSEGIAGTTSRLQRAINDLPYDRKAQEYIESTDHAVALAYRGYLYFTTYGPGTDINRLMNTAIKKAYSGKRLKNQPPFDYNATYAYDDLDQLIRHLHYIHAAPGNTYAAPCWLYQEHPKETTRAYEAMSRFEDSNLSIQSCDEFLSWEPLKVTQAIAADLNVDSRIDGQRLAEDASLRSKLFLSPRKLRSTEAQAVSRWNQNLWAGLNGWAQRDPLNERIVSALNVSFLQSQILLEDYYMDQGFGKDDAMYLALATLQTIVGYHLERFS